MFFILRIVRGLFGLMFAYQLFGIFGTPIAIVNAISRTPGLAVNWMEILGWLTVKLITAALFGGLFFGMRLVIERLHRKFRGTPHPTLTRSWWAI